jgi:hypothetical protein
LQRAILSTIYRIENGRDVDEAAQKAKVFQLKAERKAGEWLDRYGPKPGRPSGNSVTLTELDIDHNESKRWQIQPTTRGPETLGRYTKQSISRALLALEKRGLVRRLGDHRTVGVQLTLVGMAAGLRLESSAPRPATDRDAPLQVPDRALGVPGV